MRRAAEELQIAADYCELVECLKNGMGLLTHEQVKRVANAVPGTAKGPLVVLKGLSAQLVALCEENPQVENAELEGAAENAVQTLVLSARRAKERAEQYRQPGKPATFEASTGALPLPDSRKTGRQEIPEQPSGRALRGANSEIKQLYIYVCSIRIKLHEAIGSQDADVNKSYRRALNS
jgi:hypothetical protein